MACEKARPCTAELCSRQQEVHLQKVLPPTQKTTQSLNCGQIQCPIQVLGSTCALTQAEYNVVTTAKLIGAAKVFGEPQRPGALSTH